MGRVIAVANQKGGVGKTTTAINLSAALAEKNKKVLLMDIDPQGNATSGVGVEKNEVENTVYDLILGEASIQDCIEYTEFENLYLIPSNVDLAAAEIELIGIPDKEFIIRKEVEKIKDKYDFILIDCPPSLNLLTINAMTTADTVLVPIQCEYYALEGLSQLIHTINLVKERLNPYLDMEGIEVSTGSACATGSLEPSYVLLACGLDVELAHGSIRFSLGRYNTVSDVDTVIEKLPAIIKKVRSMSTRKV